MQGTKKTRAWVATGALVAALVFLSLAGCATSGGSKTLDWKQVDPSAFGSRQFNTMGLQTEGPNVRALYGYVLYGDGVTVSVSGRITGTTLGKMSLEDVQQDYQRVMRENMLTAGGNLILREVLRDGIRRGVYRNDALAECHHLGHGARHSGSERRPAGDIPVIGTSRLPSQRGSRGIPLRFPLCKRDRIKSTLVRRAWMKCKGCRQ